MMKSGSYWAEMLTGNGVNITEVRAGEEFSVGGPGNVFTVDKSLSLSLYSQRIC